jgi:hypothetical protein
MIACGRIPMACLYNLQGCQPPACRSAAVPRWHAVRSIDSLAVRVRELRSPGRDDTLKKETVYES